MVDFSCITPETAALREQYPSLRALEAGDISVWVQERLDQLISQGKQNQTAADAVKILNLVVMTGGVLTSTTTPLGWLCGLLGGGFWLWAVTEDFFDTGRIHPFPFVRKGLMDLGDDGDAEVRDLKRRLQMQAGITEETVELFRQISYLPREGEVEAKMLYTSMTPVVGFLNYTEPGKRFTAYRWLLTEFKRRGHFNHTQQADVDAYTAASMPDASIDYNELAEYRRHRLNAPTPPPPPTPEELADIRLQYGLEQREAPSLPFDPETRPHQRGLTGIYATVPASSAPVTAPTGRGGAMELSDSSLRDLKQFAAAARHLYVVALSGAGKGMWLSNYIRWRKGYEPGLLVFWIDPKNDWKESGYFAEDWIKAYRFKAATLSVADLIVELQAAFNAYVEFVSKLPEESPVLLIVDECLLVQHILDTHGKNKSEKATLETQIVRAASIGDSDNKHIICTSQSPNAGDSGVSGGVLRGLRKVVLFRGDELDVLHQAKDCGAIAEALPSDAELKRLCRHSPRNRGAYLNGQYLSMPDLPNYSGYDRDSRSWTDESKKPVNRLKTQFSEAMTATKTEICGDSSGQKATQIGDTGIHPNIVKFVALVEQSFAKRKLNGLQPLGDFVSNCTGLKDVRTKLGMEVIIKLVEKATEHNLIVAECNGSNWRIGLKEKQEDWMGDDLFPDI